MGNIVSELKYSTQFSIYVGYPYTVGSNFADIKTVIRENNLDAEIVLSLNGRIDIIFLKEEDLIFFTLKYGSIYPKYVGVLF
jgi:hypothetical protein